MSLHTKIVATLGPASMNREAMRQMAQHGARIFRCNFSHSRAEAFIPVAAWARELERELDITLTVMGDLSGPKLRIGDVAGSPVNIAPGQHVVLGLPEERAVADPDLLFIEIPDPEPLDGLEPGMPVSLSDGMLRFTVRETQKADARFLLQAQNAGLITSHKGVAFPGKFHPLPALTDKDRRDLAEGLEAGLDAFALSFVQRKEDMEDLHEALAKHNRTVPVVAKLERQQAIASLDEILARADAVMVARGDLGLEAPITTLPIIQKQILKACRKASKAAIVATQMLLSMVKNPVPTRAEATDVANAMLDGADCVMLSEETAAGEHPVAAVKFMAEVAEHAEAYYLERMKAPYFPAEESGAAKYLAYSAALLAKNSHAKAIVCHSQSGSTARLICSRRPAHMVYALSPEDDVMRYMNFFWGVKPVRTTHDERSHVARAEDFVQQSNDFQSGDRVVITSGQPTPGQKSTSTNEIKIYTK